MTAFSEDTMLHKNILEHFTQF